MENHPAERTSNSLLARLREGHDQAAWAEFVRRYGQQIYRWCRNWGLQEADAEDVTQTVLVKLTEKLRTFCYDPSRTFRAYLKTLTHYACCDFLELHKRPGAGSGDSAGVQTLQTIEARDDLVQHLNSEFDQELLEEASARVRQRVEPHTWEAFRLTALEGLSGAPPGLCLGMPRPCEIV
jgi:RNA polymerase sigma factor (sigma-70 family)